MARAIDKETMLDLIIKAKRTDPETGSFAEWLAEYLVEHLSTLTPPNEPLTLEELREMDGEPVYLIVDDQYEPLKMWALIEVVETANCVILTSNLGGRNEYYDNDEMKDDGVTAYRRPPEGEA